MICEKCGAEITTEECPECGYLLLEEKQTKTLEPTDGFLGINTGTPCPECGIPLRFEERHNLVWCRNCDYPITRSDRLITLLFLGIGIGLLFGAILVANVWGPGFWILLAASGFIFWRLLQGFVYKIRLLMRRRNWFRFKIFRLTMREKLVIVGVGWALIALFVSMLLVYPTDSIEVGIIFMFSLLAWGSITGKVLRHAYARI